MRLKERGTVAVRERGTVGVKERGTVGVRERGTVGRWERAGARKCPTLRRCNTLSLSRSLAPTLRRSLVPSILLLPLLLIHLAAQQSAQTFTGRLSDSTCGASHQMKAGGGGMSDRECLFACIKELSK